MPTTTPQDRSPISLTAPGVLRLFLALTVVVHHFSSLALGTWAVNLFFVLSGHWVTTMYQQKYSTYRRSIIAFYLSRYLRLLPLYLLCLFLTIVGTMILPVAAERLEATRNAVTNVSWLTRAILIVTSSDQYTPLVPSWSLDTEMQFYLFLPLLLALIYKTAPRYRTFILWGAAILLLPLSTRLFPINPHILLVHLSFFLFGVVNALKPITPTRRVALWSMICFFGIVLICLVLPIGKGLLIGGSKPYNPNLFVFNHALCAVLTLVALPFTFYTVHAPTSRRDRDIGNLAYPVYLFHWLPRVFLPFLLGYNSLTPIRRLPYLGLEFVVVIIGSLILYYCYDKPIDQWRNRFIKKTFS